MDKIDDGGPAFPGAMTEGMSLRDFFAAKAMQAIISTPDAFTVTGAPNVAEVAYQMADAMIAARSLDAKEK